MHNGIELHASLRRHSACEKKKLSDEILPQGCFLGCFVGDCKLVRDNIRRRYCRCDVGSAQWALNVLWKIKSFEFSAACFTDFVCWQWPREGKRTIESRASLWLESWNKSPGFPAWCLLQLLFNTFNILTSHFFFMVRSTTYIGQHNYGNQRLQESQRMIKIKRWQVSNSHSCLQRKSGRKKFWDTLKNWLSLNNCFFFFYHCTLLTQLLQVRLIFPRNTIVKTCKENRKRKKQWSPWLQSNPAFKPLWPAYSVFLPPPVTARLL